jgi:hypothetical protein
MHINSLPDAIFCAQSLNKVLPIAKLIVAAIVALTNTVKKPDNDDV